MIFGQKFCFLGPRQLVRKEVNIHKNSSLSTYKQPHKNGKSRFTPLILISKLSLIIFSYFDWFWWLERHRWWFLRQRLRCPINRLWCPFNKLWITPFKLWRPFNRQSPSNKVMQIRMSTVKPKLFWIQIWWHQTFLIT